MLCGSKWRCAAERTSWLCDERIAAVLLGVAAVRSCVAAMLSSVAQTAELRRAFRRLVSLVAAACLFMAGTLARFQV